MYWAEVNPVSRYLDYKLLGNSRISIEFDKQNSGWIFVSGASPKAILKTVDVRLSAESFQAKKGLYVIKGQAESKVSRDTARTTFLVSDLKEWEGRSSVEYIPSPTHNPQNKHSQPGLKVLSGVDHHSNREKPKHGGVTQTFKESIGDITKKYNNK